MFVFWFVLVLQERNYNRIARQGRNLVHVPLYHVQYNFAFWANWIIQATNDMEPSTDPRVSVLRYAIPI